MPVFKMQIVLLVVLCMHIVIFAKSLNTTERIKEPFSSGYIYNNYENHAENDTESCKLEIVPGEIENTKINLKNIMSKSDTNLVFIHIELNNTFKEQLEKVDRFLKNKIIEWQYVDKNEKFLVQLPVDIDLVTINLLEIIGEENQIKIPMRPQTVNCRYTERTVQNIRMYLWENLLGNFSDDYVLCNRNFERVRVRDSIYWITTVWLGYDLNCTSKFDDKIIDVRKFARPNIIPIVCFILALQYIWIYAFLKFKNENNDFHYEKGDSPYSLKRATQKFLYRRIYTIEMENKERQQDTDKTKEKHLLIKFLDLLVKFFDLLIKFLNLLIKFFHDQIDSPAKRLTYFLYFIILLPVSLYRTLYRWHISNTEVHDYLTILKPSEPLCSLYNTDEKARDCDIAIASLSTVFGAFFLFTTYEILAGKMCKGEKKKNDEKKKDENDEKKKDENDLVDIFLSSCRRSEEKQLTEHTAVSGEKREEGKIEMKRNNETGASFDKKGEETKGLLGTSTHSVKDDCKILGKSVLLCFIIAILLYPLIFIGLFIWALVLIILIICLCIPIWWFMSYPMCNQCQNETGCCKECCEPSCIVFTLRIILLILLFLCLLFSQRIIVSSITFLLRLMTYFIFVALPARINLFRYFLIAVTALTYIWKYHSELVMMASEVLDEIFENLNKLETDEISKKDSTDTSLSKSIQSDDDHENSAKGDIVKEEVFDQVMTKLRFSYRWYVLIIKCLVLIVYIFITVEALLNSGSLKSSNHFEQFLTFLFIALSPAIVQELYKTRHGYLNEEHKIMIRDEVAGIFQPKGKMNTN